MKKFFLLAVLTVLTVLSIKFLAAPQFSTVSQPLPTETFYLGGIQVNEPDAQKWVKGLKTAGMNTVEVTIYAKQGDWDSDNLWFDRDNEGVVQEIREAKAQGLHVALILRVALDHAFERNLFLWHGLIMPKTNADLESWFAKYTDFVTTWAAIAEREGVDVLGIGSEMNALTSTQPIDELPGLVQYYLDDDRQQELRQEFIQGRDRVSSDDLWTAGGQQFETLEAFLDARLAAWQGWAQQVKNGGIDPKSLGLPKALNDEEEDGTVDSSAENSSAENSRTENSSRANRRAVEVALTNQRRHLLEHHWRKLIRQTRPLYTGQLTYAANFDQYHEVAFWDALDLMGVNAYFALRSDLSTLVPQASSSKETLASQLRQGWSTVLDDMDEFRNDHYIADKPVLFTELGYTFRSNSTIAPWAYDKVTLIDLDDNQELLLADEQTIDFEERAAAMDALYQTLHAEHPSLLKGILYWKLSTQPNHLEIEPFVLILNQSPQDPLQKALSQFGS